MRRLIDSDYLTMLSRLLVGGMLLYASVYKIIDPADFARSIWFYHLVPGSLINLMALILPWLELLCGLALILGIFYGGAILWTTVLMVVFVVALSSTIVRGISVDCGCFRAAKSGTHSAWQSLLFDLGTLVFILQLIFSRSRRWRFVR